MNKSIWLLGQAYRVDFIQHSQAEWTASLVRVADNQRVAVGYAHTLRTAAGELYDRLARRDLHELAEALDRADLPE